MKRFSKVEQYYILNCELSQNQICKDLGTTAASVNRFLQTVEDEAAKLKAYADKAEKEKKAEERKTQVLATDLMIRNEKRGTIVMTQAASEKGDAHRKTLNVQRPTSKNIHKIRE